MRIQHVLAFTLVPLFAIMAGCTSTPAAGQAREFYVFTALRDFNETALGLPHDTFTPETISVNQGDVVTIHFYNVDQDERHTFTIGAPYDVSRDLAGGEHADITFTATQAGVFPFTCSFHGPTMAGQLVVLRN